ncbi:MAG TPA: DUF2461 domain-containing protein [Acidimicrobiia bacterium]
MASTGFAGFPAAAFDFFARLELDNSKAFFTANKSVYDEAVKQPFAALSDAIERRYGALHVFRPYRDVRFSKDKTPYKTAAGAVTESQGGSSYFVQVSAEGLFVGCGMYHMAGDQLERYRGALDDGRVGGAITKIAEALRAKGYDISAMESLKTAPRGYPKDHVRIELLRMKGLTTGRSFPVARWLSTPKALERVTAVWDDAKPMNAWLERNVGPSTLAPPEPDF